MRKTGPFRILRRLRSSKLAGCQAGLSAVEFALIAPVFLLMLLGFLDAVQMLYVRSILNGVADDTARKGTLEGSNTSDLDQTVLSAVKQIAPDATLITTRSNYVTLSDIGRPEKWSDTNGNSNCDDGESYTDENNNSNWDRDIGKQGNGSATDIVVNKLSLTYTPMFSIPLIPVFNAPKTLTVEKIRWNQPFMTQVDYSTQSRICA